MAYVMTYDSLLTDVRNYLDRGSVNDPSLYAQLPHLVAMAEKRINRDFKPQGFERFVTSSLTAGVYVIQKPQRWRETIYVNIGTGASNTITQALLLRTYEFIQGRYPDTTVTGQPLYYADMGYANWRIGPTPNATYPIEIHYYELLQPLDSSNQTNWLTEYAPNLLLYAVLLETSPFLKNDARAAVWEKEYQKAAGALVTEDIRKKAGETTARQG